MYVIAIDFDNTITEQSDYPITGKIRPQIKPFLEKCNDIGCTCVLNTCRNGKHFREALVALKQAEIYDLFNWKYLEDTSHFGRYGKLLANIYIDDRAFMFNSHKDLFKEDTTWTYIYSCIKSDIEGTERPVYFS